MLPGLGQLLRRRNCKVKNNVDIESSIVNGHLSQRRKKSLQKKKSLFFFDVVQLFDGLCFTKWRNYFRDSV